MFVPQQYMPPVVKPQVWSPPAARLMNVSVTSNGVLEARAAPDVAVSVYAAPGLSTRRSANVATPWAATVSVPSSRDPGAGQGAVPIDIVTVPVGTRFPEASRIVTRTAGAIATLPSTDDGG